MIYSEVINGGLVLPKKNRYTMRDVHSLMQETLFKPHKGKTLSKREAIFVVKCSAVFHGTDYAESLIGYDANFYPIK